MGKVSSLEGIVQMEGILDHQLRSTGGRKLTAIAFRANLKALEIQLFSGCCPKPKKITRVTGSGGVLAPGVVTQGAVLRGGDFFSLFPF